MTYPHCDARILHAPGVCVFCDEHSDWQEERLQAGINFTGENKPGLDPCPADAERGDTHMAWYGNVAQDRDGNPVVPPPETHDVEAAAMTMLGILKESNE